MEIRITYKGVKDGSIGYWCGFKPENIEIIEEMPILYAEDGYILIRKSDGEDMGNSVWLHDGDMQDNYNEVEEDA